MEALRSLSWFLSSSRDRGVCGECRSSGEGLRPEEEDGEADRWLEFGGFRIEGLAGSGTLLSGAYPKHRSTRRIEEFSIYNIFFLSYTRSNLVHNVLRD